MLDSTGVIANADANAGAMYNLLARKPKPLYSLLLRESALCTPLRMAAVVVPTLGSPSFRTVA